MSHEKTFENEGAVLLAQSDGCAVWQFRNESGDGTMTAYDVFPGVILTFNDFHMEHYRSGYVPDRRLLAIDHCREGRMEYAAGDGIVGCTAAGDLKLDLRREHTGEFVFPSCHYHGLTVAFDLDAVALPEEARDFPVAPADIIARFSLGRYPRILHGLTEAEHIFGELYRVPEKIRIPYFKVKILELLLFLSAFPIQAAQPQHGYSLSQVQLAEQIGAYLLQNTERRLTVAELSRYFGASATLINSSFRGVYGMSPAAFLRAQKMHGAARLLRRTDRTVLDIAGQFGYDNGSKFAKAFRDVIGVSPNAYRSGIDCDSCAPEASVV